MAAGGGGGGGGPGADLIVLISASTTGGKVTFNVTARNLGNVRADGVTELGECKWGPVTAAQLKAELEQKVLGYPNAMNPTLRRHAFVRSFRGRAPEGVIVHRLADLG